MNRAYEPGWRLAAMHDPTGRRGLWYRPIREPVPGDQPPMGGLAIGRLLAMELCSGREGDDDYLKLQVGQTLTAADIRALHDLLLTSDEFLSPED